MTQWKKSLRLLGYDYSQAGAYFVTICARDRLKIFADDRIARAAWAYLKSKFTIDRGPISGAALLNDHLHLMIEFVDDSNPVLGKLVMYLKLGFGELCAVLG